MRRIYYKSPRITNHPRVRIAPDYLDALMGPREQARAFAYRFGEARPELRAKAITVARYLNLDTNVILEVWAAIDEIRRPAGGIAAA